MGNFFQIYTALQTKDKIQIEDSISDQGENNDQKSENPKSDKQKSRTTEKIKNFALGHLDKFIDRETEMERLSGFG